MGGFDRGSGNNWAWDLGMSGNYESMPLDMNIGGKGSRVILEKVRGCLKAVG